ncbi:uncharacterized protein LY89DRAFT_743775 [Mollisia scopiformis]|uniref:Zn(2)-C6 fungal-type domain-containing protein n=1 Tax=Mollisia scopiformis TaxID=149040 RepID=A0A132B452_MOLSC|nr:uncharacterized protein LY89DRAFT_743775 [Mollisia scopiformis]KUJ06447.1 hypothetical protein LY89DRAFT_743775 [Mollisia scopiformis]
MNIFTDPPAASASGSGTSSETPRAESSLKTPRKSRSACNRCHAQKLKCVRGVGRDSSCERCLRLKTSCRFSPRAARSSLKLPEHLDAESTLESPLPVPASMLMPDPRLDASIDGVNEFDWLSAPDASTNQDAAGVEPANICNPMLDYGNEGGSCWATSFEMEGGVNRPLAIEDSANSDLLPDYDIAATLDRLNSCVTLEQCTRIDDPLAPTPPSMVQLLANLDVALYECSLRLPSPLKPGINSVGVGMGKSKMFALEELFRLTTDFLAVLTSLAHEGDELNVSTSSTTQTESNADSMLPFFAYSQRFSKITNSAGMEESTRHLSSLDEPMIFMLMSCHSRLTEIYASLFQMMRACIEHSITPRRDKDWAVILPQLQVGSIASPPVQVDIDNPVTPATSSMYMLMITMLSSQVWHQLANKMRVSDGIFATLRSGSVLTEAVWYKIMDKNDRMLQTIDETRHLLQ